MKAKPLVIRRPSRAALVRSADTVPELHWLPRAAAPHPVSGRPGAATRLRPVRAGGCHHWGDAGLMQLARLPKASTDLVTCTPNASGQRWIGIRLDGDVD